MHDVERLKSALSERYAVERELGRGGMATVYLARDLKHERKVAIKVLDPELASAVAGERFLREIRIEANLQHPNIVPLYDSGESDGFLFYVMAYVEGESLRDRLAREKGLPLEDALRITREVADALSYAHEGQGVVHRDIKPENIMLSGGHAMLTDFGIARAVGQAGGTRVTQSGYIIGTPAYMSPEQASGESDLDARTDIYSLSCVLYEMLAGEPPFTGNTAQAVLAKHMLEPPPSIRTLRPSLPAHVVSVVERGLAKMPAERFRTVSGFMAELERRGRARAWRHVLREIGAKRVWHLGALYLILGWLAIALTRPLIERRAFPDWVFATLLSLILVGFPLTLALAWSQGALPGQPRRELPRWLRRLRAGHVLTLLATLVIAVLAVRATLSRPQGVAETIDAAASLEPSRVAVLPFTEIGESPSPGLASGLTRSLIDYLSQVGPLDVIPYSGVRRFTDPAIPIDSIARILRAGTLVGASIQESQGQLLVAVELIDAATNTILDTRTIEKPRRELFALQDEIVSEVSTFLRQQLGIEFVRRRRLAETTSPEAEELVWQAEELRESAKELRRAGETEAATQVLERADSTLARAEDHDPDWVEPIVLRGWVAADMAWVLQVTPTTYAPEWTRRGLSQVERALELDPRDPGALELRGILRWYEWQTAGAEQTQAQREAAEQDLLAAVELDPSRAQAWLTLSEVYRVSGRFGEARLAARRALEADAFLRDAKVVLFQLCYAAQEDEDFDEAIPCWKDARQRYPDEPAFVNAELVLLASSVGPEPDADEGWRLYAKLEELTPPQEWSGYQPTFAMYVAGVLARAGLADSAYAVIRRARAQLESDDPWPLYYEANVRLQLDQPDQAIELLEQFIEMQPDRKASLAADWFWRPLQDDPRFQALVEE